MGSTQPLYKRGQAEIKKYILENRLQPGDLLPAETELATRFGMSRLSLREAVKGLETVGILTTRHGGGVRVAEFSFEPILDNLPYSFQSSSRSFKDLLELRESLEEGLSGKLLDVVRPRDVQTLRAIARAMDDEDLGSLEIAELDRRFHAQMYAPLENKLVTQLIEMFWQAFNRMQASYAMPKPTLGRLSDVHVAIADALESGEEHLVRAAVRAHFEDIRDWVFVHYQTSEPGVASSLPAAER